jgi:hypothetical protein
MSLMKIYIITDKLIVNTVYYSHQLKKFWLDIDEHNCHVFNLMIIILDL